MNISHRNRPMNISHRNLIVTAAKLGLFYLHLLSILEYDPTATWTPRMLAVRLGGSGRTKTGTRNRVMKALRRLQRLGLVTCTQEVPYRDSRQPTLWRMHADFGGVS